MKQSVGLAAVTVILALAAASQAGETKVVWLDELDVSLSTCGYSSTARKMSVDRHPLRLRGRTYDRGIGTHAPGLFRIDLGGRALNFQATAGIDDESGNGGTAEFRVIGDGKLLWSSGVLRGGQEIKPCSVDLKGVKMLDLTVDTTPDGYGWDHTDWVDAKIEYTGSPAPVAQKLPRTLTYYEHHWPSADQVFHPASLPAPSDRDQADAVLRRVGVLLDRLRTLPGCPDLSAQAARLAELKAQALTTALADADARAKLLDQACLLRRKVAFSNPLLTFDKILFIKRHFCPESEMTGNHMCDQYFGFNAIRGGGLFVLENAFGDHPTVRNVLENSVCGNGRFAGQKLTANGGFLAPELRFDGRQILFAWTEIADKEPDRLRYRQWTEHNTYKIFRVNPDGSELTQLTDGPWDDFDPCYLPNGRVVFISERRGGFGRCHGRPVPSYTLHSMNADGSDIVCLSPHETNEWQPSVGNDGMIVYTRWDYVDRGFSQAHHPWTTTPDGRDPRPIHGNYALNPGGRPHLENSVRAVPGSRKYMATAACHHGQAYGSIILIDPSVGDDNAMGPVKRLTPDQSFPESEINSHRDPANYAAPWPLSEDFFLCVYDADSRSNAGTENDYGVYLVDAFGNKELLYRDPAISCLDPIPLQARPVPPVIPNQVDQPQAKGPTVVPPDPLPSPGSGTVGIVNVYNSMLPLPKDVKITRLRIVQLLPKTTWYANGPRIGFGDQKGARMVLGTVPVEDDGSVYFKMPAGRPVYFQALGADGLAVQSMRSATYVHPGERLTCRGCHEPSASANSADHNLLAWRRAPSEIAPDVAGSRPFSYPILVQPVLDRNCVSCHAKSRAEGKGAPDLTRGDTRKDPQKWYNSYDSLRNFAFYWDNAGFDSQPRSTPGHVGARVSRLYQMLAKGHHDLKLSGDDLHCILLWLDCNSDFLGSYENVQEQVEGKVVWPKLE
jgi:hypothetical protein